MGTGSIPLLAHSSPEAVVAYRGGKAIAANHFLADVMQVAERLPPRKHVLNICADRYRFTVGLAASLLTKRISLLPSTHTPEVIRRLAQFAPDAFCLTDEPGCSIDLPQMQFPDMLHPARAPYVVPHISPEQTAAIVFTSGSTGTPLPFSKSWGKLARCVHDAARRLGLANHPAHALIGTVPAQHMYGFESTVLLALQSGGSFSAERPFYPADISAALARVPRPRALISTPVHLRALLAAGVVLPTLELIVSATAPLEDTLARNIEGTFGTRLVEIYGSTETGQIATRRPALSPLWHLWPEVRLSTQADTVYAHGGHVEQMTAMCDVIEIKNETEFLLHGRTADLVNIAGKRSSFGYLNAQLNSIPGVVDGTFFLREASARGTGVARLAAVAVAPNMTAKQLTEQLRLRVDPVFLPRPLLLVAELPRNATGKLPQHALQTLSAQPAGAEDTL